MTSAQPIAITGASGQVGTILRARLVDDLADQLPLGSADDWAPAIASAGAVAHLAGTLQPKGANTYERANVETTRRVVEAAAGAGVERIAFLSYVGASSGSRNAYLRTKAEAERLLLDSGIPVTVIRCLHIFGPPAHPGPTVEAFRAPRGGSVRVPGTGGQRIAPLYVGDVVEALRVALLAPEPPAGVFELGGPEVMSVDEFVRGLNGDDVRLSHIPAPLARAVARLSPSLTPALMDLLLADNVLTGDVPAAAEALGLKLTALGEIWAESARPGPR